MLGSVKTQTVQYIRLKKNFYGMNQITLFNQLEPKDDIKWAMFVPRMGSAAIGCSQAAGRKPEFMLSWDALSKVDRGAREYWPDVPYHLIEENPDLSVYGEIDIVMSVCPCGGMSSQNTSKGDRKGVNAPQNNYMYNSAEYILEKVKPTVYFGENAQALFEESGAPIIERLKAIAEKHGYSFSLYKTDAVLHGVPQRRIRTFYFFWKSRTAPILNFIDSTFEGDIKDFLGMIPKDATFQDVFLYKLPPTEFFKPYKFLLEKEGLTHAECVKKYPRKNVTKILRSKGLVEECIEWMEKHYPNDKISEVDHAMNLVELYKKYKSNFDSGHGVFDRSPYFCTKIYKATIRANMRRFVHPEEDRYLSMREVMSLMGYPLDYNPTFSNKNTGSIENFQLLTKGVVSQVSRDIFREVMEVLRGNRDFSEEWSIRQNNCNRTNSK